MPRAPQNKYWQTAADEIDESSGCFSFLLPPLIVIFISLILSSFALQAPVQAISVHPTSGLAPFFRPEIQHWARSIIEWSSASSLDPNLVAVIMQIESCGDPRARSRAGAMGLFQVMPFHFYAADNPYNPDTNAARGLAYLAKSLTTANGDARLALAGYNGGIGVIARAESTWPAETKRYVYYGAPIYQDARQGVNSSPMLDEWYKKYGVSLCQQAHERLGLP
ncbi:MAG: lytic transglycosylase domain-containing protein [Anaerolineales bacterium]|nr:lytic transglycosylase domain-containing protein [Anaerolineales bacterium]